MLLVGSDDGDNDGDEDEEVQDEDEDEEGETDEKSGGNEDKWPLRGRKDANVIREILLVKSNVQSS